MQVNTEEETAMEYAIYATVGLLSGLCFYYLARYQIQVRSIYDTENKGQRINNIGYRIAWMVVPTVLFVGIALKEFDYWQTVRYMLIILMAINVAGIDMLIRRIPNALLLGMLLLQICNMVITSNGLDLFMDTFFNSFIGMIVAYVLFVIPGLFKLRIGAGDVKYSAVIGFMLGLQGYVEAMAVMGFTIFIYYLFLKITRRGNLKTAAPMAPFLSGGVLVSLFFPLIY